MKEDIIMTVDGVGGGEEVGVLSQVVLKCTSTVLQGGELLRLKSSYPKLRWMMLRNEGENTAVSP